MRTSSGLGLAPSSVPSAASKRAYTLRALLRSPTQARASIRPRTPSSARGSSSYNTCACRSTVAKSPTRRPASICFTRQSRMRGSSLARHSSFHCSNATAPGTSKPSRNGPRTGTSQPSTCCTSTSTAPAASATVARCTSRCSRPTACLTTVSACAREWRASGAGAAGQRRSIR